METPQERAKHEILTRQVKIEDSQQALEKIQIDIEGLKKRIKEKEKDAREERDFIAYQKRDLKRYTEMVKKFLQAHGEDNQEATDEGEQTAVM